MVLLGWYMILCIVWNLIGLNENIMINRGTLYITLIFCVIFIFSYFYNIIKEYRKTKVMKFYFMEYLVSFLLAICSIFFISMVYKLGIWKNLIAIFLFLLVSIIYFYNVIKGRPKKNFKKRLFYYCWFKIFYLFFTILYKVYNRDT